MDKLKTSLCAIICCAVLVTNLQVLAAPPETDPNIVTDLVDDEETTTTTRSAETTAAPDEDNGDEDDETTAATEETPPGTTEETTTEATTIPLAAAANQTTLYINDGTQMIVSNIPAGETVAYQSSNTGVARVDASGYIIAVGRGSVTVTASCGGMSASVAITVIERPVEAQYLIVDVTEFNLIIGETAQISAQVLPVEANAAISYSSGSPEIAGVDENGLISAAAEGRSVITVTAAGFSQEVTVTVTPPAAPTASLSGYIYGTDGNPIVGEKILSGESTAISDTNGYFRFESLECGNITLSVLTSGAETPATCDYTLSASSDIYLLYDGVSLTPKASYNDLTAQLAINSVKFIGSTLVMTVGDTQSLQYEYSPRDAMVTDISYQSSNEMVAQIGLVDGIVTARAPGITEITVSLNGGQATAVCTISISEKASSAFSPLIITLEMLIFAAIVAFAVILYRNYKKNVLLVEEAAEIASADKTAKMYSETTAPTAKPAAAAPTAKPAAAAPTAKSSAKTKSATARSSFANVASEPQKPRGLFKSGEHAKPKKGEHVKK